MATSGSTSTTSSTSGDTSSASSTDTKASTTDSSTTTTNDVSPSTDTSSSTRPADEEVQKDPSHLTDAEKADQDRLVSLTAQPFTAFDAMGIERIVAPAPEGYTEPQVDPDPHEVARLARLGEKLTGARNDRLEGLTKSPDGSARVGADAVKAESNVGTASAS